MPQKTGSAGRLTAADSAAQRGVSVTVNLLLFLVGFAGLLGGVILVIGSDMIPAVASPITMGAGCISAAIGSAILQQLVLLGSYRMYRFADPGGEFRVPRSALPLVFSVFGAGGFALWSFWFFSTFGLSPLPCLLAIVALGLTVLAIACRPRGPAPLSLATSGIIGANPRGKRVAWKAVVGARVVNRFGLPIIQVRTTGSLASPSADRLDFAAFDFGVPPQAIADAINRRASGINVH